MIEETKTSLHPRNIHRNGYDFDRLKEIVPELASFIKIVNDRQTIDFANSAAVLLLNKALLKVYYQTDWNIPKDYLTPGVPGRADYIHHIADLISDADGNIPTGGKIIGLDVGTGANMIYPILGNTIYQWNFVASDIDERALQNCVEIIENNPHLAEAIDLQLQENPRRIFKDLISPSEKFTFTICNPPFHASAEEANKAARRKVKNLSKSKNRKTELNFGGQNNELWCDGGELNFIIQMLYESKHFTKNCQWFTTLVSKAENVDLLNRALAKIGITNYKWIDMSQGNKQSRVLAWTFTA